MITMKTAPISEQSPTFVGVDGYDDGWVAIEVSSREFRRARTFATFAELLAACSRAKVIAVARQPSARFVKIREVDAWIDDARIHEIDPDVSFRVLNGDIALEYRKESWAGAHLRRRRLVDVGIVVPDGLGEVDKNVGVDDILDAAIAAWSARRIGRGQARRLPAEASQQHASGRTIWA
jgi:predicted RNase H-like nuclease